MTKVKKYQTLEEGVLELQKQAHGTSFSIGKILSILSGKGRPLILVLLSLPFCQPIQIPGLSLPFGLAIAILGFRTALGKNLWLPKKLLSKKVSPKTFQKILDKTLILLEKIKPWIHPRFIALCRSSWMERFNGVVILVLGLLLALPLPIPVSNLAAAWAIFLIAIGILEDDGVFVVIGYAVALLTLIFFMLMALTVKSLVG